MPDPVQPDVADVDDAGGAAEGGFGGVDKAGSTASLAQNGRPFAFARNALNIADPPDPTAVKRLLQVELLKLQHWMKSSRRAAGRALRGSRRLTLG